MRSASGSVTRSAQCALRCCVPCALLRSRPLRLLSPARLPLPVCRQRSLILGVLLAHQAPRDLALVSLGALRHQQRAMFLQRGLQQPLQLGLRGTAAEWKQNNTSIKAEREQ